MAGTAENFSQTAWGKKTSEIKCVLRDEPRRAGNFKTLFEQKSIWDRPAFNLAGGKARRGAVRGGRLA